MNKRLLAIAKIVQNGKGLIDVGTDHGYLPVYLAQNAYSGNLLASDINEGPLRNAVRSAREAGVENRIEFILCDGLAQCDPLKIDTVVIAGMGGDTMCGILDQVDWLFSGAYELLLQPMTKVEVLRFWLIHNGFRITGEHLVEDGGKIYPFLSCRAGQSAAYSDAELYTGKYTDICAEPLFPIFLEKLIGSFEKSLSGLRRSAAPALDARRKLMEELLSQLLAMQNKYREALR